MVLAVFGVAFSRVAFCPYTGENTRGLWEKGEIALEIWRLQDLTRSRAHAFVVSYRAGDLFLQHVSRRSLIGLRVLTDGVSSACLRAPRRSARPTARRRGAAASLGVGTPLNRRPLSVDGRRGTRPSLPFIVVLH